MNSFDQTNLEHIKDIFENKTGVALRRSRPIRRRLRPALILAAVLGCLTVTTVASQGLFSVLDGDDLSLNATYEGEGIVAIEVENRSDKDLKFQPQLKLSRWITSEEIEAGGTVSFENTDIPANSMETMIVDLSQAYDMELLEQPLVDDWYYLTLTNHNFIFGQDWFCSVDFAQNVVTPVEYPEAPEVDAAILGRITESLRPYFEKPSLDIQDRRVAEAAYVQNYTQLLEDFDETVVSSVSPILPGNRIATEKPYLTVGDPEPGIVFDDSVPEEEQCLLVGRNWFGRDGRFKLVARQGEYALVLSAVLPSEKYEDAGHDVPLLYILTYEKTTVQEDRYTFIYGALHTFGELEPMKVYEDEQYVCYEVSELLYSDLEAYVSELIESYSDLALNEANMQRVENIYHYYKQNLGRLFYYRQI